MVKNLPANAGDARDAGSILGSGRCPGQGNGNHSTILSWESRGQRSLAGYSPWGCKELDTTEYTHISHLLSHLIQKNFTIYQTSYPCCSDKKTDLERILSTFKKAAQSKKQVNMEPGPAFVMTQSGLFLSLISVVFFLKEAISICPQ